MDSYTSYKCKGKGVPLHAKGAKRGGRAPFIVDPGSALGQGGGQSHVPAALPPGKTHVLYTTNYLQECLENVGHTT